MKPLMKWTPTPTKGDVVFFDYEIKDLKGTIIYSELELRPQIYYVDKQDIMMGLRDGIKLMHKMKVTFLFLRTWDLVITVTIKLVPTNL
jgi:hypothetical protein